MPLIETQRQDIRLLKGVHLFHFAGSNCSQRVRFVLEEKRVPWESHHVNLIHGENATSEFIALNPNGVVPVLVHDGATYLESNDIIRYVEEQFEGPRLAPEAAEDQLFLTESLERSSDFQSVLKLLSHEFLFKPVRRMNEAQLQTYAEGVKNQQLVDFMREFSSKEGFSRARITAAVESAEVLLAWLEIRLETNTWLTGDEFGLADISWIVNFHRFKHFHYPLTRYPAVLDWLRRLRARPAFARSITAYESREMITKFHLYTLSRRLQRTSVHQYC